MAKNYSRSFVLVLIFLSLCKPVMAQLNGWSYNIPIDIINKTNTTRTNYQELLVVNTKLPIASGKMQASGADIRIGDQCTGSPNILAHYLMSDLNTDSTKIWVMMPSVPANSVTTIFLYYGNSGASSTSSFSSLFPNAKKSGGPNDSIGGSNTYDWFELETNDTLFVKKGAVVQIHARVALINGVIIGNAGGESPGGLNNDGNGAGAGTRSSNNSAGSGGAGYGGYGGDGGYDAGDIQGAGGSPHGTRTGTDISMGSSGASSDAVLGGAGGAGVLIKADIIQFNGSVKCNGAAGAGLNPRNGGGGSGGGVLLWGKWIKMNGSVSANGGDGGVGAGTANDDGGGGSGGRIKVLYNSHLSGSISTSVAGGKGGPYGTGAPGEDGDAGTVYKGFSYFPSDSIIPSSLDLKLSDPDKRICTGTAFTITARTGFTNYTFYKNSTQLASGTSNIYVYKGLKHLDSLSVVGILSSCFTDIKSVIVMVDTLPLVHIQSDTLICAGDTLKLKATGAKTYQWTGRPKTDIWQLVPGSSNTYSVIGKDNNGCADTSTKFVQVSDFPTYSPPGAEELCAGDSVTLLVTTSASVLWEKLFLQQSLVVKPSTTRYYDYEVYDHPACKYSDSVLVTVNALPNVYISGKSSVCPGQSTTLGANGALFFKWGSGNTNYLETVSPKTTTTYTVIGKDDNGCGGIATKTVSIDTPATISISGDMEICKGESTTLTAAGGVTYSWGSGGKNQNETVTPAITTSYPVVSVDAKSCKDTTVATVVVNDPPVVSFALPAVLDTVCISDSPWPLSGESPSGGKFSGKGVNTSSFNPATAGIGKHNLKYVFTDANGCRDSATDIVTVDACAGVSNIASNEAVRVFPNPMNAGFLQVEAPSGIYYLSSPNGQFVLEFRCTNGVASLDLSDVASGIYYLRSRDTNLGTVKIIVQH